MQDSQPSKSEEQLTQSQLLMYTQGANDSFSLKKSDNDHMGFFLGDSDNLKAYSEMSQVPDSQVAKKKQEILVFPRELNVSTVPSSH